MKKWQKITYPLIVIVIGALGAGAMFLSREEPETRLLEPPVPLVRVMPVVLENLQFSVKISCLENTVKNLALSTAILGSVGKEGMTCLSMDQFLAHSICVGVSAKAIATLNQTPAALREELNRLPE